MNDLGEFNDNFNQNEYLGNGINAQAQELEENLMAYNEPLISKISSRDFLDIFNDIIPSLFFILFLSLPFYFSPSYCDLNVYLSMKTLIGIYIIFIIRALIKLSVIYYDKKKLISYKIFLSLQDLLTSLCYYICIYFSYIIFSKSPTTCFKLDTFTIFCFFTSVFLGIISFFQTFINFIMLAIYFFFMLDSYINNPIYFYNHYGMDPEVINNLPTVNADEKHSGTCIICLKDINKGRPIIILSCPGSHYFHGNCIKDWLLVKTCCPICRSELVL